MSRKGKQNKEKMFQQKRTCSTTEIENHNFQRRIEQMKLQTVEIELDSAIEKAMRERDTAKIKSKTAVLDMTCSISKVLREVVLWILIGWMLFFACKFGYSIPDDMVAILSGLSFFLSC